MDETNNSRRTPFRALRRVGFSLANVAYMLRKLEKNTSLEDWQVKLFLQLADRHITIEDVAEKLTSQEFRRDGSLIGVTVLINSWIETILSDYLFKFKYMTPLPTPEETAARAAYYQSLSPEDIKRLEAEDEAEFWRREEEIDASIEAKKKYEEEQDELAAALERDWAREIPLYLINAENEAGEDNRDALTGYKIFKVDAKHPSLDRTITGESLRDGLYDADEEPRPRRSGKKRLKKLRKRRKKPLLGKNKVVANKGT